ncbi:MAG TPA: murein L,D-transpeptidase catalytic domain family protein [Bdellovibrio sp.]|nr:murein L,D-transpeptidase catalytic domain family protein [Bdellovibrio sp.]
MRSSLILMLFIFASPMAHAGSVSPSTVVLQKIKSQGVPAEALKRLLKFMNDFHGRSFIQDTYTCFGKSAEDLAPCDESQRRRSSKTVVLGNPQNVAIIDYSAPSIEPRFFLINLKTGDVQKYLTAHGSGSGKSNYATKFSNSKDSKQTALGIYLAGETYLGRYGKTMRMYGLQGSNDQAYNRDIVLHGAWYVSEHFINSLNPQTGQKYGRLGLSWGCPAMSLDVSSKVISVLSGSRGLIMHYYGSLMDEALSGREVDASVSSYLIAK